MKISERNLPAGWMISTLEDVAEIHDNLREPVNSAERAKRPGSYPYYGATGQVGWIDDYRQDGEYVLLGEDGAPFFEPTKEKAYLVSGKCWVNNHAHVLKGQEGLCSNRYLLYALNQTNYRGYANGTTRLKLTQSAMRQLPINLAPFPEQHRIVAKIEELFSELDKGIENLKTACAQLKVYRQALLKYAFEGKLTAQWRAENQGKLEIAEALLKRIQQERAQRYQQQLADWEKSPSIPLLQRGKTTGAANILPLEKKELEEIDDSPLCKRGARGDFKPKAPKPLPPLTAEELAELPELPEGWGWVRLLEACEAVVDCHNKTAPYQATGIPLVRTPSIRDMKLNFDDAIRYVSQETYEYWSRRCPPLPGDILFTREAPMGEAALIPVGKMICMGQRIMLLRPGKFLSGKYLLSATQNPIFKKVADKVAVGTGVKHLRVGDVERLVFPLCSVSEQNEIANQLDARISETDQLELTITTSLQQAEALRQSILKRAFSGQLVPQDPHDEPASKLLERIKAERTAVAAKPRKITKDKA